MSEPQSPGELGLDIRNHSGGLAGLGNAERQLLQAVAFSQSLGGSAGEEHYWGSSLSPTQCQSGALGVQGAPSRAWAILTWERAVSMAAPEVPPHSKQAVGGLLGAGPGWACGSWGASGHDAAGALVR